MPGGKAWRGTIGPRRRDGAAPACAPTRRRSRAPDCRAAPQPGRTGSAPAGRRRRAAPATEPASPKIGTSTRIGLALAPDRAVAQPIRRAPGAETAPPLVVRERAGLGEPERDRAGQHQRVALLVAPLPRQHVGVERMMQAERAGAEQPRQQRQAYAGKRRWRASSRGSRHPEPAGFRASHRARRPAFPDDCAPPAQCRCRRHRK